MFESTPVTQSSHHVSWKICKMFQELKWSYIHTSTHTAWWPQLTLSFIRLQTWGSNAIIQFLYRYWMTEILLFAVYTCRHPTIIILSMYLQMQMSYHVLDLCFNWYHYSITKIITHALLFTTRFPICFSHLSTCRELYYINMDSAEGNYKAHYSVPIFTHPGREFKQYTYICTATTFHRIHICIICCPGDGWIKWNMGKLL